MTARPRLLLLLLAGLALGGCLFLSPDERPRVVEFTVVVDGSGPAKVECDPTVLLTEPDLLARGRLFRGPTGQDPATTPLTTFNLQVGPLLPDNTRLLTGLVEVEVAPGTDTWIGISLFYAGEEGRNPLGNWTGQVTFEIGQTVTVDNLLIEDHPSLDPALFQGDVAVSAVGESGSAMIPQIVFFGPTANRLTASYRVEDVQWDEGDPGSTRTILASMELAFQPIEIFALPVHRDLDGSRRLVRLDDLVAGVTLDQPELTLVPVGPVNPGEELRGILDLRFEDGNPPQENGAVRLTRVNRQPCD